MGDMQPLQVSVQEAARLLSVCRQTLYRMQQEGQIVFRKTRGRTMVPMSEVRRISGVTEQSVVAPVVEPRKLRIKKRKLFPILT